MNTTGTTNRSAHPADRVATHVYVVPVVREVPLPPADTGADATW